jgi:putative ABC transport system permease protein
MSLRSQVTNFLASLFRRGALDQSMDEEFEAHLALRAADLVGRGLSPEHAARQARLEFGNLTVAKEAARESWSIAWLERLSQDVRYAFRTLGRNPGFALVAVLSLGFGIGATTTVYGVIDALDFRPLPYANADRLVWLAEVTPYGYDMGSHTSFWTSPPTALDWIDQSRSYDAIGVTGQGAAFAWMRDDVIEQVDRAVATPGFFSMLGVHPLLGRELAASDTIGGPAPVALVSYRFWQNRLGGDRGVIGRRLTGADRFGAALPQPLTIIGVLPDEFRFIAGADLWTPVRLDRATSRLARFSRVVARLRDDRTIDGARTELATITARLALENPTAFRGWSVTVEPLRDLLTIGAGSGRFVLFAVTLIVLLVAVLNVAGLLMGRAIARTQELAMRTALGASRGRLVRQQLVEGACIGIVGGGIGVTLALLGVRFAATWFSLGVAILPVTVERRVLGIAVVLSLIVGIAAAALPAIRAGRADLSQNLRGRAIAGSTTRALHISHALVTSQIAVGLVLLAGAVLLSADFIVVRYLDLGYDPRHLYETSLSGSREEWVNPLPWIAEAEQARSSVGAIRGIAAASLEYRNAVHPKTVRPEDSPDTSVRPPIVIAVDPAYFKTLGIPIAVGRSFTDGDGKGRPLVAMVDETAARAFWHGLDPIGRRVILADSGSAPEVLTVVGVTADVERGERVERHADPTVYRPIGQATIYHAAVRLFARTPDDRAAALLAAQAVTRTIMRRPSDPFQQDDERLAQRFERQRIDAAMLDVFAAFGLLLAAMGVYGTIAYAVTQRTREIGIRVALGAQRTTVVALIARRGVIAAIVGVSAGLVASLALTRVLRAFLTGTSGANPVVFVGAATLMIVVSLAATFVPAWRATRVDPVVALRAD